MPKTQKTFYLNDDLGRLLNAVSDSTGASFTKVVTAALIKYLLADLGPAEAQWMRMTVALERGDGTLPQMVADIARNKLRLFKQHYTLTRDTTEVAVEEAMKEVARGERKFTGGEFEYNAMCGQYQRWIDLAEAAVDPLGKVVAALNNSTYYGPGTCGSARKHESPPGTDARG